MTDTNPAEPGLELGPAEQAVSIRLEAASPVPRAAFRSSLRRLLEERDPGHGPRPNRLRSRVGALAACGPMLPALAALVASGSL
jgi:hypothetical protein